MGYHEQRKMAQHRQEHTRRLFADNTPHFIRNCKKVVMVAPAPVPTDAEGLLYVIITVKNTVVFYSGECFGMWHFSCQLCHKN